MHAHTRAQAHTGTHARTTRHYTSRLYHDCSHALKTMHTQPYGIGNASVMHGVLGIVRAAACGVMC